MVSYTLLAGAYTTTISSLLFNTNPASLSVTTTYPAGNSPSWMSLSPVNQSVLYATNEVTQGRYLSFLVGTDGALQQIGNISSDGNGPAFATPLSTGTQAAVLNYNSGNMIFVSMEDDLVSFTNGTGNPYEITFTPPHSNASHPHFALQYKDEVFVVDLGSDEIWRRAQDSGNKYSIVGSIPQPNGSGPRRAVIIGRKIYTLHETANTLTQQTIPDSPKTTVVPVEASFNVVPSNVTDNLTYAAGELLSPVPCSRFQKQYLYASNRNTATTDLPPEGDAIAIFSVNPLKLVAEVYTGVTNIRGMEFFGDNNEFLVASGLTTGGTAVFQRTEGGANLKLLARSTEQDALARSTFVWVK